MTIPKQILEAKICNKDNCKEINRLNNIINKAIEYIEQKKLQPRLRTANTYSLQERQLLDILKGKDNND